MTDAKLTLAVLVTLFDFARGDLRADHRGLTEALGISDARLDTVLTHLASRGLVDGVRLTLTGLAVAAALRADRVERRTPIAA